VFWISESNIDNPPVFRLLLSSACTTSRLSLFPTLPAPIKLRRGWEGTQLGQLTQMHQREIPYHRRSCSAIKTGGRGRTGGGCLPGWPLLRDWLGIGLLVGGGE